MKHFFLFPVLTFILLHCTDGFAHENNPADRVFTVKAFKVPRGEIADPLNETSIESLGDPDDLKFIPPTPKCYEPEYGDSVPFPAAVVKLGSLVRIAGKGAEWLPPYPDSEINDTVEGIDADNDCIRDDIEHFIARMFPAADQQKTREYLFDYAKWLGFFLRPDLTQELALYYSREQYIATECARREFGNPALASQALDSIFAEFHNTFPRSYRYIENNSLLGGTITRDPIDVICDLSDIPVHSTMHPEENK